MAMDFFSDEDCDDDDATIPVATEICDGVDNDCDGDIDEGTLIFISMVIAMDLATHLKQLKHVKT